MNPPHTRKNTRAVKPLPKGSAQKTKPVSTRPVDLESSVASNEEVERRIGEFRKELSLRIKLIFGRTSQNVAFLAPKLGVSRGAIYSWINGDTVPEVGRLKLLAAALGVSIEWLVGGKGSPEGGPAGFLLPRFFRGGRADLQPPFALNRHDLRDMDNELMNAYERGEEDFIIIEVQDDSMEPTLEPGDRAVATWGDAELHYQRGLPANGLYVVRGLQIRRLEWYSGEEGEVGARVRCDNPIYGAERPDIKIGRIPKTPRGDGLFVTRAEAVPDLYSPTWFDRPVLGRVLWRALWS